VVERLSGTLPVLIDGSPEAWEAAAEAIDDITLGDAEVGRSSKSTQMKGGWQFNLVKPESCCAAIGREGCNMHKPILNQPGRALVHSRKSLVHWGKKRLDASLSPGSADPYALMQQESSQSTL
jgi:hypothetical protein